MKNMQKREKTGGRKAGTPNKTTSQLKSWISNLIDDNRDQVVKDLKKLDPKERLAILEKLMQYVVPRQQSISIEAQIQAEYEALERLLDKAPDSVLEEITRRISNLNKLNNGNETEN